MKLFSRKRNEPVVKPELGVFHFDVSVAIVCMDCNRVSAGIRSCTNCGSRSVFNLQVALDNPSQFAA